MSSGSPPTREPGWKIAAPGKRIEASSVGSRNPRSEAASSPNPPPARRACFLASSTCVRIVLGMHPRDDGRGGTMRSPVAWVKGERAQRETPRRDPTSAAVGHGTVQTHDERICLRAWLGILGTATPLESSDSRSPDIRAGCSLRIAVRSDDQLRWSAQESIRNSMRGRAHNDRQSNFAGTHTAGVPSVSMFRVPVAILALDLLPLMPWMA